MRGLKVLDRVFHRPMKEQQVLPPDQISLLFANLEEMLDIHSQFNNSMKAKRKEGAVVGEVGDLLYSMVSHDAIMCCHSLSSVVPRVSDGTLHKERSII